MALRQSVLLAWLGVAVSAAIGLPLLFLGPALTASMIEGAMLRFGTSFGWWKLFLIAAPLLVPMLLWFEHRTRGEFFLDEMRAQGANTGDHLYSHSRGEWELKMGAARAAAWIEVLLFAPRMTLAAWRHWRDLERIGRVSLERAADVVLELADHGKGIDPACLLRAGESQPQLRRIVQFLQLHDWVDLSKGGERIWITTMGRKRLAA